ncbi:MAG TPA: PKD domain-containing protein [Thermoplasmata archaeon]|nr:PKD domain-containing protein [Thermoplasmata archaeon]
MRTRHSSPNRRYPGGAWGIVLLLATSLVVANGAGVIPRSAPNSSVSAAVGGISEAPTHDSSPLPPSSPSATSPSGSSTSVASAGPGPDAAISVQLTASPRRGHISLDVSFTATARGSVRALEYNFTWQFGDGSPTSQESVNVTAGAAGQASANHTYGQVGSFVANVTVTDGVDPTASQFVTITSTLPLVASALARPGNLTLGRPLQLLGNATGGSPPYTYIWSGVPSGCGVSGANLSCVPRSVGPFTVHLQVSDAIPNYASTYVSFVVNPKLTAAATYTSWYHCVGALDFLTDNFTGVAKGGTPPYSFHWNPGDGTANLTGANASHNYTQSGLVNVTLSISDGSGATANHTLTISTSFVTCGGLPPFNPLVTPALIGGTIAAAIAVTALAIVLYRSVRPTAPQRHEEPGEALPPEGNAATPAEESVPPGASGPPG